uniref:CST complex subunit CTC1 n=1 Tax=Cicer arietinum TaxID=3827 RepID=A0A1S2YWU6_CICAR|nr:CST complex subunit CTC1 isoform X2 [Cicer arietinum]
MEHAKTYPLADLLHFPRPLTSAASLPFLSTPPPPHPQHPTDHRILDTLNYPTVIVGTLTLPTHTTPFFCSCFKFSDGSTTVCCDILSFRLAAVGKQIRVTAWNFIPFKHPGDLGRRIGFLEIIKWCFTDPNDESNLPDFLPLKLNCSGTGCNNGGRNFRGVHGVVESVGPLSIVPCITPPSGEPDWNSSSKVNLLGFLVHLLCCECKLCSSRELVNNLRNGSFEIENINGHSFTKIEILYFCGNASSFHPVMTKLIGNRVVVLGLKKKLVYITKEESCLMYLTLDETVLHVCPRLGKLAPCLKSEIKGKGECGSYTGVIRGVYMNGMALELDNNVWLLLTDRLHTMIHGLRVGSIISVRNVHFVDPKFSWTKVVILGACVKTSIIVESFSPLETVCNVVWQSSSMLGKFIQSLPFSARLWVLLLISSLRKKFAGILSDNEILGSKHKEGLAQMHASSLLSPSLFQTQHGAFLGLSRHDSNGCSREMNCSFLELVVPTSIFIYHCINILQRMLKAENHCKLLSVGNHFSILSRRGRYNGTSVRRILPSEDVGIVLLGYLKVDPLTRRLQLVDATGGIDVLIPDLPLTWNSNDIFEVTNYDVIVDGNGELVDQLELNESLSCRVIFNCTQVKREFSTSISVYCLWKNIKCRNFPLYPCINSKNETKILESGSYQLLRVSHKFPLQEKYSNNVRSNKSSTFVEAILLPYILLLDGKPGISHSCNVYGDKTLELSKYCFNGNNEEHVSIKRQKLIKKSVNTSKDEFHTSVYELNVCSNTFRESKENTNCDDLSSPDISCMVTFRGLQKENVVCPALLRSKSPRKDMSLNSKPTARKILLEFSSDTFLKYQLLQIGGYYIIEHNEKDCFSTTNDAGFGSGGAAKFLIDYGNHIWSLAFIFDDVLFNYKSVYTSAEDSSPPVIHGAVPKDQIEQQLRSSNGDSSGVCSDVCIYLPVNLTGLLEDNIMESEDGQIQKFATSEHSANICFNIGTVVDWPNFCSGPRSSHCLFPEGKLISLKGNVVDIHDLTSSYCSSCSSGLSLDALQMKVLVGTKGSFCIHVLVHHSIVNIFGSISKHAFPTGFGPGVTATFHRILDASGARFS